MNVSFAVKFVYMPHHKNLKVPKLNYDICIGCGVCEFAYPTKPHKAIYVQGNPIHLIAEKPKVES